MNEKEQIMDTETTDKKKLRFWIGVILILINYVFFAASIAFSALALRGTKFPWWFIAAATYVLSWIIFIAGILIAGREAVHYIRVWAVRIFRAGFGNSRKQ